MGLCLSADGDPNTHLLLQSQKNQCYCLQDRVRESWKLRGEVLAVKEPHKGEMQKLSTKSTCLLADQ